jgi:hypothetical protein
MRIFNVRENILMTLLAIAVVTAVTYGVVTFQTPYGCDSNGVASGPAIDWQVLAKPCIYIYFTGIVGGSALLILLIPVPEKKSSVSMSQQVCRGAMCRDTISPVSKFSCP